MSDELRKIKDRFDYQQCQQLYQKLIRFNKQLIEDRILIRDGCSNLNILDNVKDVKKYYIEFDSTINCDKFKDMSERRDRHFDYMKTEGNFNSMFWSLHTDMIALRSSLNWSNYIKHKIIYGIENDEENVDIFDTKRAC